MHHPIPTAWSAIDTTIGALAQTTGIATINRQIVLLVGVVLVSLLVSTLLLTVGVSVYQQVKRSRRNGVRDDIRDGLLTRLYASSPPDWEAWVAGLSTPEQDVAEELLDEYLRQLEGSDAARLHGLGSALGITARSTHRLTHRDEYVRLNALTWLTLLQEVPPGIATGEYESSSLRERAAVARLLYEADAERNGTRAVRELLEAVHDPYPVFGVDTLYWLTEAVPDDVVEVAASDHQSWSPGLLTQVLLVSRNVETGLAGAELSWVISLLEHDNTGVRAEAALTLARFGWREPLRESTFLKWATQDRSPIVRGASYTMLGSWGGDRAIDVLIEALAEETDQRALLAGGRALVDAGVDASDVPDSARPAWQWVREQQVYDERARRPDDEGGATGQAFTDGGYQVSTLALTERSAGSWV